MPLWILSNGRALLSMIRCKNVVVVLFIALFGAILLLSAWNVTDRRCLFLESNYLLEQSADICKLLNYCSDKDLLMKAEHCPSVRIKHTLTNDQTTNHSSNSPSVSSVTVVNPTPNQVEHNLSNKKTPQHFEASVIHASVSRNVSTLLVKYPRPNPNTGNEHSLNHLLPATEVLHYDSSKERQVAYLLAVMVISSPSGKDRRQVIRETWKKGYEAVDSNVAIKFVIGTLSLSDSEMASLQSEHAMHKDLVLLHSLIDNYQNLTRKVLSTLVWASDQLHFSYLLKCDDDTYVRVNALLSELRKRRSSESLYWGYFTGRNRPLSKGKWAEHNWFLCDHFLPFAMGGGYIISADLVHRVARNADGLQLYSNEDTSVGVWLSPYKAERKHDTRFNTEGISRGCSNSHIVSHKQSPSDMRSKHHLLLTTGSQCRREYNTKYPYQYNWHVPPSECCRKRNWA